MHIVTVYLCMDINEYMLHTVSTSPTDSREKKKHLKHEFVDLTSMTPQKHFSPLIITRKSSIHGTYLQLGCSMTLVLMYGEQDIRI